MFDRLVQFSFKAGLNEDNNKARPQTETRSTFPTLWEKSKGS